MTTAIDLLSRSMRRAGVLAAGETPEASETMDALAILNGMLEQWSIDGLYVYVREELIFTPASLAPTITVGPSGDITADRPVRIDAAFSRQGDWDRPMDVIGSDRWTGIIDKGEIGRPALLYYAPTLSDGTAHLWPVPDSSYEMHLMVGKQLDRVEQPSDQLELAPGYDRALFLSLAVDLCLEFGRAVPAGLPDLAADARASVKRANLTHDIAQFDPALLGGC